MPFSESEMKEEPHSARAESVLSWSHVAGSFDAFGCVFKNPTGRYDLRFTKTNRAVIERLRDFVSPESNILSDNIIPIGNKRVYRLIIGRYHDVIRVAKKMLPRSIVLKSQLSDALRDMKKRGFHYKHRTRPRPWTEEEKIILLLTLDEPRAEVARRLGRTLGSVDLARFRIKRDE